MNRAQLFFAASAVSFATIMGSMAHAVSTLYSDRVSWQAAAASYKTIDFATDDSGNPISSPAANVNFATLSLKGVSFLDVHSFNNSYIYGNTNTMHINLPANTTALAADLSPLSGIQGIFTVTLSTGEIFSAVSGFDVTDKTFFGLTSPSNIQWVEINLNTGRVAMDDFSFVASNPVLQVRIDIKPGTTDNQVNPINPDSGGLTPVSIISTSTFNAANVAPGSVRFGHNGTEAPAVSYSLQDTNGDGLLDLVLQFKTLQTGILCGDTSAKLSGQLTSGQPISGSDVIKTVGCTVN